uniref:PH domain-containing protein n=2 Tax=Noccaea caerulescens TaxID=107243 RepID=A0A1J3K2P9_NOCCA
MQDLFAKLVFFYPKFRFMGDGTPRKLNILPDHFSVPSPTAEAAQDDSPSSSQSRDDISLRSQSHSQSPTRRKLRKAALMLNLFTLRRLPWVSDGQEKVELTAAELESLKSELSELEERESYLKAQLEHVDEVLRSARLSGYLFIRSRWAALPGEPPPLDDAEVDDWLPRFVVLQGACLFFYLLSTDLSPQDSTLVADIVEVGSLPSYTREFDETHHCFYILTRQGLRFECSSTSKTQVDSWLSVLHIDCRSEPEEERVANGSSQSDTVN